MALSVGTPSRAPSTGRFSATLLLFAATMFLSSFLMFVLEPMAAKMVLPLLGGSPSVWNTCVVFFQAALLAGYGYAHGGTAWLGVRRHMVLHVGLLLLALLSLPIAIQAAPPPESAPVLWLLGALTATIGLPFFVLATATPLLQKWFSRTGHADAADPYFLYAASNLGSLVGLLFYPAALEPLLRLRAQSGLWTVGYVTFAAAAIACAFVLWRRTVPDDRRESETPRSENGLDHRLDLRRRLRWIVLAAASSSLMLAVTTFISTDVAAVPLLWIVPLALYLVTFVLAFGARRRYIRVLVDRGFPLLLPPLVFFMVLRVTGPMSVVVPVHLAVFFLAALLCHSELADDRPPPVRLTEFYFWIAFGGVLGSLFNTLVAPALFAGVLEYPLMLVVVCLLRRVPDEDIRPRSQAVGYALAVLAAAITLAMLRWGAGINSTRTVFAMLGIPALLCLRTSRLKYPFAVTISLILLTALVQPDQFGTLLHSERTFFGTYRVRLDPSRQYYSLAHGTTIHGMQSVAPERRSEPLTYYHRSGPFGELFNEMPTASRHAHIAVVGLGVGSLAAYRQPAQAWTFFEIDPAVERIARRQENFTYLSDCGPACRVVLGDARLSLRNAPDHHYGLIVLDAFSSDAIPMHLMTREAVELYLTKLAPDGALAFHISNRHLRLEPVLGRLADNLGLSALATEDLIADSAKGKSGSDWLVMARTPGVLGGLWTKPNWSPARMDARVSAWTDDFSNIVRVFGR